MRDEELDDGLVRDPRLLLDPRLLGTLHRELRERVGERDAAAVLLRAGFYQGLRDAARLLRAAGSEPASSSAGWPAAPLVAMQLGPVERAAEALATAGGWPEHVEAEALLASLGRSEACACSASAGYASGWLSGLWEADVLAVEERCAVRGDAGCRFVAREARAWRERGDEGARPGLSALRFDALRSAVARELARGAPPPREGAFDRSSPAVHVWGPVMVVPYAGDETAGTVAAVAADPAAVSIGVVVIDLEGAALDDGFAPLAVSRAVDTIQAWGAEPVLAGPSPLVERLAAEVGGGSLLVHRALSDAIAAAFRIAEAQRNWM